MTIAQQLNVKKFPFIIKDDNGNEIYFEDSKGYWYKREYDSNSNIIYHENSNEFWEKQEFDSNNNIIYYEDSNGDWYKQEFDSNGNNIYFENSKRIIRDNRPKPVEELTLEQVCKALGKEIKIIVK